ARELMAKARTADGLRICQAVVFPLADGMSIKQTAAHIGRSLSWTIRNRSAFIAAGGFPVKDRPGGRKRANMTVEEECAFLEPFFEKAKSGGILVVGEIHKALEKHLGRKVALASAYNLLHRHNWRKLAPDKQHVESNPKAQECWKKNSRRS
ncbi:winged helix-turn-helix domain-containing protein, partial [Synergistaceae bacterium OttesenSCG-928-I11]|nr:winged helix-turn-helix domain-containing protein [Synergistaceae bacterium OttesenSCG-928-I11]